jgi:hypothetical protein
VTPRAGFEGDEALAAELREHVARMISPIAKPASLLFTADLPKTRSGKIMRRLLRDIAEDKALGDTTTLADAGVVDAIKGRYLADGGGDEADSTRGSGPRGPVRIRSRPVHSRSSPDRAPPTPARAPIARPVALRPSVSFAAGVPDP